MTTRLTSNQRKKLVQLVRDWALSKGIAPVKHIEFLNTVFNGERQNAPALTKYLKANMDLPTDWTPKSIANIVRRAVGKGSLTDGTSPELIKYFNNWIYKEAKITAANIVGIPDTVAIIQKALNNTTFSPTELLTKKYTIFEFLERIGVQVVAR